jgi:cysteine desulfurase family protein
MDNGATSFPKAPGVAEAVFNYLKYIGASVNRGAYDASYASENTVYETRELLCQLFNFHHPENVVFTKNITESLNVILKGFLEPGDHVIVSSMEHNAVMRPLNQLRNQNVQYSKIPCDNKGRLCLEKVLPLIKPTTKAFVMTHASNVCGAILDIEAISKISQAHAIPLIIDTAQTAGLISIDNQKLKADAITFTGHKSLLGPQGIGGFILSQRMASETSHLIEGGTGSLSDTEFQPEYMPDKFEAGTPNVPGIYGLNTSLKYLLDTGIHNIYQKEMALTGRFLNALSSIPGIDIIGEATLKNRTGIVSIDFQHHDNGRVAHALSKEYGIMTRSGLHCAPSAHETLGTFPKGTVRFGLSHFLTPSDIDRAIDAVLALSKREVI